MHGTREQLESYLNDNLDLATRRRLDAHVANCLPCAFALAEAGAAATRWERRGPLGRLVRVDVRERPRVVASPRGVLQRRAPSTVGERAQAA